MNNKVRVVEVGPRDGLQNEATLLSAEIKAELVNRLADAGLKHIETGSFVSPKWVPQMANSDEVFRLIQRHPNVRFAALTPNLQGFEQALKAQASEIAVFAAASESFSQRNINCSISESIERFKPIINAAKEHGLPVRGYISCVLGCPYEGGINLNKVLELSQLLLELGCYEISLGDTIGVGTSQQARALIQLLKQKIPVEKIAVHFHDTYGQALANVAACLEEGVRTVDSSVAGLGGCPYAKGASGNLASEDLVYMLHGNGFETGIQLDALTATGQWISKLLNQPTRSKAGLALYAKQITN